MFIDTRKCRGVIGVTVPMIHDHVARLAAAGFRVHELIVSSLGLPFAGVGHAHVVLKEHGPIVAVFDAWCSTVRPRAEILLRGLVSRTLERTRKQLPAAAAALVAGSRCRAVVAAAALVAGSRCRAVVVWCRLA